MRFSTVFTASLALASALYLPPRELLARDISSVKEPGKGSFDAPATLQVDSYRNRQDLAGTKTAECVEVPEGIEALGLNYENPGCIRKFSGNNQPRSSHNVQFR